MSAKVLIIDGKKRCPKCKIDKDVSAFRKDKSRCLGISSWCRKCDSEDGSRRQKKNKEHTKQYHAEWYLVNKERSNENSMRWQRENREYHRELRKLWKIKNPDLVREGNRRHDIKSRSTEKGKLSDNISRAIRYSLKSGGKNNKHWEDLVGYTTDQLYRHLNKTIPDGYTWDDYMNGLLQVDHKIPQAVFNFESVNDIDFKRCWALKNLQLLPANENRKKSDSLNTPFQPALAVAV